MNARVAVVVPCFNCGRLLLEAIASLDEPEPLEVVVVDDASDDPVTHEVLTTLETAGVRVLRMAQNAGAAGARTYGMRATAAPFVFPLDADDLALPGRFTRAADLLEAHPEAVACIGDYEEFGNGAIVRAVPAQLDPYRIAFTNEYAVGSLFRRSVLERHGGWRDPLASHRGYEDWNLWMDLAQEGATVVHLGDVMYRRRLHAPGLDVSARRRHAEIYRALKAGHPRLFAELPRHRANTDLTRVRKLVYPLLYGERRLLNRLRPLKPLLDRAGIWTAKR